jgi:small-conductance mechanosensitive channel
VFSQWRQQSTRNFNFIEAVAAHYIKLPGHTAGHKLVAYVAVAVFIVFAIIFLHVLSNDIQRFLSYRRLGAGRAASISFAIRIVGYLIIALGALNLMSISVAKLLLGGAVVGIILGVAAQQALGNFFASIVLIIAHPYSVGDAVIINSGALGGLYEGTIKDIGLTHTRLLESDGTTVALPNATILSGATIKKV